jgi:hypothetical protein
MLSPPLYAGHRVQERLHHDKYRHEYVQEPSQASSGAFEKIIVGIVLRKFYPLSAKIFLFELNSLLEMSYT